MAIYHFTTKIIKASAGKSAVASAAYQAGQSLYSDRTGQTFSYTHKEEVMHTGILLPENAPERLRDRATLWNEVESVQKNKNSRYARAFEFALPNEWNEAEAKAYTEAFLQKAFVSRGMAVDYAIHWKKGNHHVHVMSPVRGFTKSGEWAQMEKKDFARDENGNKIPILDPQTGQQKVRVRKGKGEEKLWERITVQANDWNNRTTLLAWRQEWQDFANDRLDIDQQIDCRSFEDQGLALQPTIHEGYAAREIDARGGQSDRCAHNRNIKEKNERSVLQVCALITGKVVDFFGQLTGIYGLRSFGWYLERCASATRLSEGRKRDAGEANRELERRSGQLSEYARYAKSRLRSEGQKDYDIEQREQEAFGRELLISSAFETIYGTEQPFGSSEPNSRPRPEELEKINAEFQRIKSQAFRNEEIRHEAMGISDSVFEKTIRESELDIK